MQPKKKELIISLFLNQTLWLLDMYGFYLPQLILLNIAYRYMISKLLSKAPLFRFTTYAHKMKQAWTKDPSLVHEDWDRYFKSGAVHISPISAKDTTQEEIRAKELALSAYFLIRYYRSRGHENATLDPLNLKNYEEFGKIYVKKPLQLDLRKNKILVETDLDVPFRVPKHSIFAREISSFLQQKEEWTLREIQKRLKQIYCGFVGLQSMHLSNYQEKKWLMKKFEDLSVKKFTPAEKLKIFNQLNKNEGFSYFLNEKMKTSKRFGVQGLCSMISGLNQLVQTASQYGIEYMGFGMAHRGRLNALKCVFNKAPQKIFAEFQQNIGSDEASWGNSGDVKYHLGITSQKVINGKKVRLSILPNPSHLQAVNPVVMGHLKAVQDCLDDEQKGKNVNSMSVLIHGDAAVAGQGVVYQCLQMSYLNHYNNYGVIHVVANNQIGFTTTPAEARTGLYCTDVAKAIQAPIIHVNADEPEIVSQVMKIAVQYRQTFFKDIFVDIIGYRRYGHNEQDQPSFTQPMMYQQISNRPNLYQVYREKLLKEGVITEQKAQQLWEKEQKLLADAYNESRNEKFDVNKWKVQSYYRVVDFANLGQIKKTGLPQQQLKLVGEKITEIPQAFTPHPSIKKIYEARRKAIQSGQGIDFALAEGLAFGTLLKEGFNVRMGGQDVERGTFSHRHAVIVDQKTEQKYMSLRNLLSEKETNRIQIQNSLLSQYAALGFEYGYSLTNPNTLTIWEAQFGDFSNGAQIVIDNYLTSGQAKWGVQNGLVLNLPHGMDGQGPQHSSARPERYLQLCNEAWVDISEERSQNTKSNPMRQTNLSVICVSNAANLFHAYRRQMRRDYRKPLINLVSKKLLKLREATSSLQDFESNRFNAIIGQTNPQIKPEAVKKVVILCGQAYHNANQKRKQLGRNDIAFIRIEQLAPFYYDGFKRSVRMYKNATEFVWFQQQHRNSGAWNYLAPRLDIALNQLKKEDVWKSYDFYCVSRRNSASPAVGKKKKHDQQQAQILKQLFR